jgi:hypothetical protein
MTVIELSDEQAAALKAKAEAHGLSIAAWLEKLTVADTTAGEGSTGRAEPTTRKTRRISERIAESMSDVPAGEFAKLPKDGARQVDHYVYGLPKGDSCARFSRIPSTGLPFSIRKIRITSA